MITTAFRQIRDNAWFGDALFFHPTSEAISAVAEDLPDDIAVITTEELFADTVYQPLNLGTAMGQLSFARSRRSKTVNYREIVVLGVPNDISIVAGTITSEFQTRWPTSTCWPRTVARPTWPFGTPGTRRPFENWRASGSPSPWKPRTGRFEK